MTRALTLSQMHPDASDPSQHAAQLNQPDQLHTTWTRIGASQAETATDPTPRGTVRPQAPVGVRLVPTSSAPSIAPRRRLTAALVLTAL